MTTVALKGWAQHLLTYISMDKLGSNSTLGTVADGVVC